MPPPGSAMTRLPFGCADGERHLGMDTLEPLLARADATGSGLFVLTRTSNPGAGAIQDLDVDGKPLFHRLAEQLAPIAAARCDANGGSALGIVAGATWPEEARALRDILPSSPFLVPGFGAQGPDRLMRNRFAANRCRMGGGLINSTRGLIFPKAAAAATSMAAWRQAIDDAVEASRAALASV